MRTTLIPHLIALVILLSGCCTSRARRDGEFARLETQLCSNDSYDRRVAEAKLPVASDLAGPHALDEYIEVALSQNPKLHVRRKQVEAAAHRVPQAASLDNPSLTVMGFPFDPNMPQTASGRMRVEMTVNQPVPWPGKLQASARAAEAETDMARAAMLAAELEVIEQVKRAYYDLYATQQTLVTTKKSRDLALELSRVAESRFRANAVSQQDLLRAQTEVTRADTDLVRLRQELISAQARLARLLHISPDTPVEALNQLPHDAAPRNLEALYTRAIAARPELHAQLAEVRQMQHKRRLAALGYFPDFSVGVNWGDMTTSMALSPVADGVDNVGLGLMAELPVYRRRIAAGVREAEAETVASARMYDALRDETQEEVKDLFTKAVSQQEMLRLFRDEIIPRAEQTLNVSLEAYKSGQTDFLQLTDNWRQLLQYQIAVYRLEAQLHEAIAMLERVVGGRLEPPAPQPDEAPKPQTE